MSEVVKSAHATQAAGMSAQTSVTDIRHGMSKA
jgi:hypothetical protein